MRKSKENKIRNFQHYVLFYQCCKKKLSLQCDLCNWLDLTNKKYVVFVTVFGFGFLFIAFIKSSFVKIRVCLSRGVGVEGE